MKIAEFKNGVDPTHWIPSLDVPIFRIAVADILDYFEEETAQPGFQINSNK